MEINILFQTDAEKPLKPAFQIIRKGEKRYDNHNLQNNVYE